MSVTSGQVGVTGAAVEVVAAGNANFGQAQGGYRQANRNVLISNSGQTAYFGGTTGVTAGSGFPVGGTGVFSVLLHIDEALCAVSGTTGSTVSFLATGS